MFLQQNCQEHMGRNFRCTRLEKLKFPVRVFNEKPARVFLFFRYACYRAIPHGDLYTICQNPMVFFLVFFEGFLFCSFCNSKIVAMVRCKNDGRRASRLAFRVLFQSVATSPPPLAFLFCFRAGSAPGPSSSRRRRWYCRFQAILARETERTAREA